MLKTQYTDVLLRRSVGIPVPARATSVWRRNVRSMSHRLLALIPVWNREDHICDTLTSLESCVDGVIVLDDGSTDATPSLLRESSLVIEILTKPPKPLVEWDDAANRLELYRAAARYQPEWLLCIDADERLGSAFGRFAENLLGVGAGWKALSLQVIDVTDGMATRSRSGHRMYRYSGDYTFDRRRLHCRLLPIEITPEETLQTNMRLLHDVGGENARLLQKRKYEEADPENIWQSSYDHLLKPLMWVPLEQEPAILTLEPVTDDGCHHSLLRRTVHESDWPAVADADRLLEELSGGRDYEQALDRGNGSLAGLRLDAYIIERAGDGTFRAEYCYDSTRDQQVSSDEAIIVEEYRVRKDFAWLVACVAIARSIPARAAARLVAESIESLTQKGVFRRCTPASKLRPRRKTDT